MTARARSTDGMHQARRADSEHKRQRALQAVQELEAAGEPITFATVARRADVSTWLVYAPGVKEAVLAARDRQRATPGPSTQASPEVPATGLRTDLALARAEITRLRQERDALRAGMQRALGARLDQLGRQDLIDRIDELTRHNEHLLGEVDRLTVQRDALSRQVPALEEDLAAARTSLRRMIREGNLPDRADTHPASDRDKQS
ncbi:DUF6262 family protein [Nonomuraea turkmeniaca]|uniref:DUF6262 family protein n=1 Tax=Nonomuraea turkmeniaca TaxID=103838 RepID=UPI001B863977|nr:DUF6262 family protein [Nonomuraea turkmeniaca]